jgi:hypothetical protein
VTRSLWSIFGAVQDKKTGWNFELYKLNDGPDLAKYIKTA